MIAEKAVSFSPERDFINKLNAHLEYKLNPIIEKRVEQWLKEYKETNPLYVKSQSREKIIYKTVIRYIDGEKPAKKFYNPEDIIRVVCEYFNMPKESVKKRTREYEVVRARRYCMYFIKKYTTASLKGTALSFGSATLDHTTVIHNIQKLHDLMEFNEQYVDYMEAIEKIIINEL